MRSSTSKGGRLSYPKEECPFLEVLRTGAPVYDHEAALTRKDGSLFPGLCSSAPISIEGKIVGSVMSFGTSPSASKRKTRS
jgi:hypothetical protein